MQQPELFQPASVTVTELSRYLRMVFESDEVLRNIWVNGEISNLSRPSSGHVYFTLKDEGSALRCVIWKTAALRLRVALQNGMAVEAHGAVSLYERDGTYQLYIDTLRPAGEGRLLQEFLRLKARLEAEGLFDPQRKRPLPELPTRIGIVTSPTGAALQDMLNTLRGRYPLAEVILAPTAVQGSEAPAAIVAALQAVNRLTPDVIILARGGGSLEDLWAFNDERVVRAIVASSAPVITGIGHETDFTLADFAADVRAPTPTGAAVQATPDAADLRSGVALLSDRLFLAGQAALQDRRMQLEVQQARLRQASPLWRIGNERQRLDAVLERTRRSTIHRLQLERAQVRGLASHLTSLNPLAVLQRGFAVVSRGDGSLVMDAGQVQLGEAVHVRLARGQFDAQVKQTQAEDQAD